MLLQSVEVRGFRNLSHVAIGPGPHWTALLGENGQGKTNLLEALYLAASLRPLRPASRRALVQAGSTSASITANVAHRSTGLVHEIGYHLDGAKRRLSMDGKPCTVDRYLGGLVTVAFMPDDLELSKGGPDNRRRFLDRGLLNMKPAYLRLALRYARALRDKNRLLTRGATNGEIDAFDEVLAHEGARVVAERMSFVSTVAPLVSERFAQIAHPAPKLAVRYRASVEGGPEEIRATLAAHRAKDRARGRTSAGPHLDDLELSLDGAPARERASQGQHRAIALALKLAELQTAVDSLGEPPVLLLDDMSSELDARRTRHLFDVVQLLSVQVFLTATEPPRGLFDAISAAGRSVVIQDVRGGALGSPWAWGKADSP